MIRIFFYFFILIDVLLVVVVLVLLVVVDGLVVGQTDKPRYQLVERAKQVDVAHPETVDADQAPISSPEGNLKAVRTRSGRMHYADGSEPVVTGRIDEVYLEDELLRDRTAIIDPFY